MKREVDAMRAGAAVIRAFLGASPKGPFGAMALVFRANLTADELERLAAEHERAAERKGSTP